MPRYVETSVKLTKDERDKLRLAILNGEEIALTCKLHKAKMPVEADEMVAKVALTPIQKGRVGAGKRIKMTRAQSAYMKGRGFLVDAAKVASAVGQKVADEFVPDSEAANTLSNILLETADVVERGLTGKQQVDYNQAAKNNKMAIDRANAFLLKSSDAKRMEWRNNPFARNRPYEEYAAQMTELASRKPLTAKQIKEQRFARMRGDPVSQAAAQRIVDMGKSAVSKELKKAGVDTEAASGLIANAKKLIGKGEINDEIARYLQTYLDEE